MKKSVPVIIHDASVTQEMLDEVCAQIVKEIITDGMTVPEQLKAVYTFVKRKFKYSNEGIHDDERLRGYQALTELKTGDCFYYCCAAKALLTYMGYDTITVRRDLVQTKVKSNHFWLLVNCGTKEEPAWYHFDATPQGSSYYRQTYMLTDAQVEAFSLFHKETIKTKNNSYYYVYDKSLYPASATEIIYDLKIDEKYYN